MKHSLVWILTSFMLSGLLGMASMSLAAEDTWTKKADMPTARFGVSTSVVDGKIYAIDGVDSTVEEYDPAADIWTKKADMPTARKALSTIAVNGKIYAIGGSAEPHWDAGVSTVEEYDTGSVPALITNFNPPGKLPTLWGEIKHSK